MINILTDVVDYIKDMTTITVPAGELTQSFTIAIADDDIMECNETFNVTILSINTCGVNIGNVNVAEVRIKDNDGKKIKIVWINSYICRYVHMSFYQNQSIEGVVSLNQSQYSVEESAIPLKIPIAMSNIASEDVIVEVTINNGSIHGNVE